MALSALLAACDYGTLLPDDSVCDDTTCRQGGDRCRQDGEIQHVVFSPSGRFLASASKWGGIKTWSAATGEELGPIRAQGHCRYAMALAFTPDDRALLALTPAEESGEGWISEWDLRGELRRKILLTNAPYCRAMFSADATRAAFQTTAWKTCVVEVASGRSLLDVPGRGRSYAVALSRDGSLLAMESQGTVSLWDVGSGTLLREFPPLPGHDRRIDGLSFSPDSTTLAVGICSRGLILISTRTGTSTDVGPPGLCANAIAHSPDGSRLAVGNGKEIAILESGSGALRTYVAGLQGSACVGQWTFSFSPDGATLASGAFDSHALWFWDTRSGRLLPLPSCTKRGTPGSRGTSGVAGR